MILREKMFWDFQLLDHMNNGHISLDKSECLFRLVHGGDFKKYWDNFIKEREDIDGGGVSVTFGEVELFLCSALHIPNSTSESRYWTAFEIFYDFNFF